MGVWSVGIVDSGVVDEFEATYGDSLFAYDFYYSNAGTDGDRGSTHGTYVAESVELTNGSLERIDLQVTPNDESFLSQTATSSAFNQLLSLDGQGWHIGAVNASWGGDMVRYTTEIGALADRGIYVVAAAGNGGSDGSLETPVYPAAMDNVIAVGSHDGSGNPSGFSLNSPGNIHVLADGEDYPEGGLYGTSFATPQVAAGVTTVQALADAALERRLTFDETVDVLQQGGGAALSSADPADGETRYYLFDHDGSVDYFLSSYLDAEFSGYEYMASYADIASVFAGDPAGARGHLIDIGVYEGREVGFDGLEYIASYGDLVAALGSDREAGALHYLNVGQAEGRAASFDGAEYLAANADLQAAFGEDVAAATRHYVTTGYHEGRSTSGGTGDDSATTSAPAVSEGSSDLPENTSTSGSVAAGQSVTGTIGLYDRDWFAAELTADETVVIELRGSASGGGTLYDPELYVRDDSGTRVAANWDSGTDYDAYLTYTPGYTGTHYLEVYGFDTYTGTYTLSVDTDDGSRLSAGSAPGGPAEEGGEAADAEGPDIAGLASQPADPGAMDWLL